MAARLPLMLLAAVCLLGGAGGAGAVAPPIKCGGSLPIVDQTICESPEYVAMDREIAALYDRGRAQFTPDERHRLAQSQLAFLKVRSGCAWASHHSAHPGPAVGECVRDKMEIRLRALRAAVDRGRL